MAEKKAEVKATTYEKKQIVKAKKYEHDIDVINALLEDGKSYTLAAVDKIIEDFKKGKVK